MVRTSAFQAENRGSTPRRATYPKAAEYTKGALPGGAFRVPACAEGSEIPVAPFTRGESRGLLGMSARPVSDRRFPDRRVSSFAGRCRGSELAETPCGKNAVGYRVHRFKGIDATLQIAHIEPPYRRINSKGGRRFVHCTAGATIRQIASVRPSATRSICC